MIVFMSNVDDIVNEICARMKLVLFNKHCTYFRRYFSILNGLNVPSWSLTIYWTTTTRRIFIFIYCNKLVEKRKQNNLINRHRFTVQRNNVQTQIYMHTRMTRTFIDIIWVPESCTESTVFLMSISTGHCPLNTWQLKLVSYWNSLTVYC